MGIRHEFVDSDNEGPGLETDTLGWYSRFHMRWTVSVMCDVMNEFPMLNNGESRNPCMDHASKSRKRSNACEICCMALSISRNL